MRLQSDAPGRADACELSVSRHGIVSEGASKPLRTTSAQVGKGYIAAVQAGTCLHTMSVLQAYQADLLKELDEGEKISSNIVELRKTAYLALRATKETARAIRRSMAALVAAERHLWLTLSGMKEKDWVFLMVCSVTPSILLSTDTRRLVNRQWCFSGFSLTVL